MRSLLVRRKILRLYLVSVPMLYARCDVPEDARNEYVLRTIASEHSSNVNSACTCYLHADVSLTANTRVFGDFANALSVRLFILYAIEKHTPSHCQTGFSALSNGLFGMTERHLSRCGTHFPATRNSLFRAVHTAEPQCGVYGMSP